MMKSGTLILWILAICALEIQVIRSSPNPGFQARVTEKGFNYAAQTAIDSLSEKIQGRNIPDQHGDQHGLEYSLTGMHITDFNKPGSNVIPQTGRGLAWQATGLGLSLHADFKYKYKKILIPIRGHGSVDVSIRGTTFTLSVSMGRDAGGRPSITSSGCNCEIGHFSLKFHGGASWLYNLLKGFFNNPLKKQVQKIIYSSAMSAVDKNAEESLSKLPVTVDIAHKFLLDYRLLSPPTFTSTFMDTFHKGEVFWSAQKSEAPFPAPATPALTSSSKMVYFMASDYLMNTLGYVAHQHGLLKTTVTGEELPPNKISFLNTTCQGGLVAICLGKLIPQTGAKYPNSTAELHMSSSQPPKMTISPSVMTLNFAADISFDARVPNGSAYFMFSVNVDLNTTLKASIKEEQVYGEIDKMNIRIISTKSGIGQIDVPKLQTVLNAAVMLYVKPQLNKLGADGFPLPVTGLITFTNTELTLAKDSLILGTDVKYTARKRKAKQVFQVINGAKSNHYKYRKM